jgi:hypothetical protein
MTGIWDKGAPEGLMSAKFPYRRGRMGSPHCVDCGAELIVCSVSYLSVNAFSHQALSYIFKLQPFCS